MTANTVRSAPTSARTARMLWAAASRSTSSSVGRAGRLLTFETLRGGGLQIVELSAGAGDHRRQVRGEHHHVEAALHRPGRERGTRAVHDGLDAVLVRRIANLVAGGDVHRLRVVAARREAEREREVRRPDVDGVEPGRGADLVQVGEAFL